MSICLKDNEIIFHLITILLFYSKLNVIKQCDKKIAGVISCYRLLPCTFSPIIVDYIYIYQNVLLK